MAYQSERDLKYLDRLSDIPNPGPDLDAFGPIDKLNAAELAEARVEADINDGAPIPVEAQTPLIQNAVEIYATKHLFMAAEEPSSAVSGQLVSGSAEDSAEFVELLGTEYDELIYSINESDADETQDRQFSFFSV